MVQKIEAQHGDVCFAPVTKEPEGLTWEKVPAGYVVERGEGVHTHVTTEECEIAEKDGVLYMRDIGGKGVSLDHEEHKVKILSPGVKRKGIELTYDAEADEARQTRD